MADRSKEERSVLALEAELETLFMEFDLKIEEFRKEFTGLKAAICDDVYALADHLQHKGKVTP